MSEMIIWVDDNDQEIGHGEKLATHVNEQLHRAFSVFLYNQKTKQILIHRRAPGKYHSGGLWTNTCCSHPRKGEQLEEAVVRRLEDELGLTFAWDILNPPADMAPYGKLEELGSFKYLARYEGLAEHEIDHVFYLPVMEDEITIQPNPEEMDAVQWIGYAELKAWFEEKPEEFTAWFPGAFQLFCQKMDTWLKQYADSEAEGQVK